MIKYQEDGEWRIATDSLRKYVPKCAAVKLSDPLITVDSLVDLWASELEGDNRHSQVDNPSYLAATLAQHGVPEPTIEAILWDIIETQGGWI